MRLISIVTIAKNHAGGLDATLQSIENLQGVNIEIVLVIGSSIDETLKIAQRFTEKSKLRAVLVLQTSSGIYEAMNEGISACSGDSIIFMNAGDRFENKDCLSKLATELSIHEVGVVIGGYIVDKEGQVARLGIRENITPLNFAFNRSGGCHQAMLYKTSTIKSMNLFPLEYRLAADFDLTLRIIASFGGRRIPDLVAVIEPGGVADAGIVRVHREKHRSRSKFFEKHYLVLYSLIWMSLAIIKVTLKIHYRKLLR